MNFPVNLDHCLSFRQRKATEFRLFLLYTGPVVLKGKLTPALYKNFMCLSVAIRILLNNNSNSESYDYAEKLLKCFVEGVSEHYGDEQLVYNVHSLIHLADDARKYGSLNTISCFPFESFLGHLKCCSQTSKSNQPNCSSICGISSR